MPDSIPNRTDPRLNEYTPIKCNDCNTFYYVYETILKCRMCDSENFESLTHPEADKLFKEIFLGQGKVQSLPSLIKEVNSNG